MAEEPQEPEKAWFNVVVTLHVGIESSHCMLLNRDMIPELISRATKGTGVVRDIRIEPASPPPELPEARRPSFPPEGWAEYEPLEVDDELPPLDRPKIP